MTAFKCLRLNKIYIKLCSCVLCLTVIMFKLLIYLTIIVYYNVVVTFLLHNLCIDNLL